MSSFVILDLKRSSKNLENFRFSVYICLYFEAGDLVMIRFGGFLINTLGSIPLIFDIPASKMLVGAVVPSMN